MALPSTPKATFRPEHLFDAINDLWQVQGRRPYSFKIVDPGTKIALVEIELPSSKP